MSLLFLLCCSATSAHVWAPSLNKSHFSFELLCFFLHLCTPKKETVLQYSAFSPFEGTSSSFHYFFSLGTAERLCFVYSLTVISSPLYLPNCSPLPNERRSTPGAGSVWSLQSSSELLLPGKPGRTPSPPTWKIVTGCTNPMSEQTTVHEGARSFWVMVLPFLTP